MIMRDSMSGNKLSTNHQTQVSHNLSFVLLRNIILQEAMFQGASSFDQDISSWIVSLGESFVSDLAT